MEKKYNPTPKDRERISYVYGRMDELFKEVMGKQYPEMNDCTPTVFWDDSQKRLNAYVETREAQGKEEWQANIFTGTTRNKVRSYVSSVSRDVPPISITATSELGTRSKERADWLKGAVRHSFVQTGNPEMDIFADSWSCGINGTVIKHQCWLTDTGETEEIVSYDALTGKVESKKVKSGDGIGRAVEVDVAVERLIPGDAYIVDIQEQPELIWFEYYDRAKLMAEFGEYPDFESIPEGGSMHAGETDLFFGDKWEKRTGKDRYEVVRYYSKRMLEDEDGKETLRSCYRIVINGVLMLDAPLLWGGKRKIYPFGKGVFEPFAKPMFWGNSLPNVIKALQDEENTLENSLLDKTHRSLETPMLVGNVNKDDLEMEDRLITGSDRIYVENVDAVKPMPIAGVTQGELNMLDRVSKLLSEATVDALQGGATGSGSTAREVVLANERANDIKNVFFLMMKDLFLQKARLRAVILIANYTRKDVKGNYRTMNVGNSELSNGRRGTMRLGVAEPKKIAAMNKVMGYSENRKPFNGVDVAEQEAEMREGEPVEMLIIPPGYLDDYEYDLEIQTESMKQKGKSLDLALLNEFSTASAQLFPDIFRANSRKFFDELARNYGQNPAAYDDAAPTPSPEITANLPV